MFGNHSENGYTAVLPGISIKTLNHGEQTLMTEFLLTKGAGLPPHAHSQEQTGYLVKGSILLTIGESGRVLGPGDSWNIPSNVIHRAEILEDSVAVEVFSPLREDYLKYLFESDFVDLR
jgi:quercetin dioxygenase-like cupin family protein